MKDCHHLPDARIWRLNGAGQRGTDCISNPRHGDVLGICEQDIRVGRIQGEGGGEAVVGGLALGSQAGNTANPQMRVGAAGVCQQGLPIALLSAFEFCVAEESVAESATAVGIA